MQFEAIQLSFFLLLFYLVLIYFQEDSKTSGSFYFQSVHLCSYLLIFYIHFGTINILLEFKTEEENELLYCLIDIFKYV